MTSPQAPLADEGARRAAIAIHDRSFLVEAGAGSGKTAVLAGRIAMLLADGVEPKFIAAVTFTEFAASELLIRVRAFVGELAAGRIPAELGTALPDGLSEEQRSHLSVASQAIDEITCSTIHGFCQRLITPYPVEADIDPGATVMDRDQADLGFLEIVDSWLRKELSGDAGGRRCHVNHRVTSLWAQTPEIMQRSSLAATVSSRRRGIGGVFGGRPDGVGR